MEKNKMLKACQRCQIVTFVTGFVTFVTLSIFDPLPGQEKILGEIDLFP